MANLSSLPSTQPPTPKPPTQKNPTSLLQNHSSTKHLTQLLRPNCTHNLTQLLSLSDPYTFPSLLKACAKSSALAEGTQIHNQAIKLGFLRDIYVHNSLIQMYLALGRTLDARKLFDRMPERNVVTWNIVLGGYAELGLWEDVILLFRSMVGESLVDPNAGTLLRVVTACARLEDFEAGRSVHRYIMESGVDLGLNLGNALVNMYAKFGEMEAAKRLFDEMTERDVVSWTTLVSGYARCGDVWLAREIFDEMPGRNGVAWNAMIAGYVVNDCFREAISLYENMLVQLMQIVQI